MTSLAYAPTSPLAFDLPEHRLSQSSSLHPARSHTPDSFAQDISNFEDILLDGSSRHAKEAQQEVWGRRLTPEKTGAQPSLNDATSSTLQQDGSRSGSAMGHRKKNGRGPRPSLQRQIRSAIESRHPVDAHSLPRSASGMSAGGQGRLVRPSTATFPVNLPRRSPELRSRSSSPSPKQPASASFADGGPNVTFKTRDRFTAVHRPRRQSWQIGRKSSKQLEAEYRESDDELPEEASLWNVPMSPRPLDVRPPSDVSSRGGSPEIEGKAGKQRPLPISPSLDGPVPLLQQHNSQKTLRNPPPPRMSSLPLGKSVQPPISPPRSNLRTSLRDHRAQSWTLAMANLSEEARVLTENLEIHNDQEGRQHEYRVQNSTVRPVRPSSEAGICGSTHSMTIELPAIQKSNVLIDPMPPSREKEAVLTRTRPSWLPPKDPKEEKRHLKEYQRMVASSVHADRRREARMKAQKCEKDDTRQALNRIWEQYVYPEWDRLTHEHRTRELWWRGVSPKLRGQIWMRAMGNPLALTHRSYSLALQRIQGLQTKPVEEQTTRDKTMLSWVADLERDSQFIFPEHNLFQRNRGLWAELMNVCSAYVGYRSDVGYRFEIQLIAATLLLQIPSPGDVFVLLANCLNGSMALAFLTNDTKAMTTSLDHTARNLRYKVPRLHDYLFNPTDLGGLALTLSDVFDVPLRTLLTNGLDLDRLARVWDCYVFEGEKIMIRATVAILRCLQPQIFAFEGSLATKRRKICDLLNWGKSSFGLNSEAGKDVGEADAADGDRRYRCYWSLDGDVDEFMLEVKEAGRYNEGDDE